MNKHDAPRVMLTYSNGKTKTSNEKLTMATKLHKQFSHPLDHNKLKFLRRVADVYDKDLFHQTDIVTDAQDTCSRYKKVRSKTIASNFNVKLLI